MRFTFFHLAGFFIASSLLGFHLGYWFYKPSLSKIETMAQVVTAFGVLYAALTYYVQNENNRRSSVITQIRVFRTEIIKLSDDLTAEMTEIDRTYNPTGIKNIEEFTYSWIVGNYLEEFLKQNTYLQTLKTRLGNSYKSKTVQLLNSMEELAAQIVINKTILDPRLTVIKRSYVENVEHNIGVLLQYCAYDNSMYINLKKVYQAWVSAVDRKTEADIEALFRFEIAEALRKVDKEVLTRVAGLKK